MITFPNAKINLGLNIVGRRPDGYHLLETVFYPIPLEDALEVCPSDEPTAPSRLHLQGQPLDGDEADNLVMRAYRLLRQDYDLPPVRVWLYKRIPSGAGLGGGSADAAFMLKLLNRQFALGIAPEQLERYAVRLGADCAFFIANRPAFAEGIGEVLSAVDLSLRGYHIYIVKPDVFVSTRDAFARVRPRRPAVSLRQVIAQPVGEWRTLLRNDFEDGITARFPVVGEVKEELYRQGAVYAAMSGSGSAVYGLFAPGSAPPRLRFGDGFFTHCGVLG